MLVPLQLLPKSKPESDEPPAQHRGSSTSLQSQAAPGTASGADGSESQSQEGAVQATPQNDGSHTAATGVSGGQAADITGINKQFTKALFYVQTPKAMYSLLQKYGLPNLSPNLQPQQPQQQQQQQRPSSRQPQAISSPSIGHPSDGPDLSLLDGRSLVAALVWLIKFMDGHPVGNTQQQQQEQQQRSSHQQQHQAEAHASSSVGAAEASRSSSSSAVVAEAVASKAGVRPLSRRKVSHYEKQLVLKCAGLLTRAADAYQQRHAQQQGATNTTTTSSSSSRSSSSRSNSSSSSSAFTAPDMCSLVYACAKLQQPRPRLVAAVAEELEPLLFACSVDELFRWVGGRTWAQYKK